MEATSFWADLRQALRRPRASQLQLWDWLKEKLDLARYRPQAAEGTVCRRLTGREGPYYVLKNPTAKTYYRLSERDHFLWERMNGQRSVQDLVVAYFLQYGSFAFARVATLIQGLKANLLLTERPVNVYSQVAEQLQRRNPSFRLNQLWQAFLEKQFAMHGIDAALGGVYRAVGWLLFSRPMLVAYAAVSALGLFCFAQAWNRGGLSVVTIRGSYMLGAVGLIVAELASIFVHEMAHALTVKRYGREVRRGGFMVYFGMPAFFVDTTDIWLEGKGPRLAVTWAGPYSELILGGLASIAIMLRPRWELSSLLFQFAFVSYLTVFINLNPLLELDGYFLLMDWLEIPMLRGRSLEFLRSGLPEKLRAASRQTWRKLISSFSREEAVFTVFGAMSAVWTAYAIFYGALFYQDSLAGAVRDLWSHGSDLGKVALALATLALALPFALGIVAYLLRLASQAAAWAAKRGLVATTWRVAALVIAAIGAALALSVVSDQPGILRGLGVAALAVAACLARSSAQLAAGSRFRRVFALLGVAAVALLFSHAGAWLGADRWMAAETAATLRLGAGIAAYAALLAAALWLFEDTDLRQLHAAEKWLLVVGLAASYVLVGLLARSAMPPAPLAVAGTLLCLLALALSLPTIVSFWRTQFGPAWALFCLALGGMVVGQLAGQALDIPYLLFAASLLLQRAAYARIASPALVSATTAEGNDTQRLRQAFAQTATGLFDQLREISGGRRAQALRQRFNSLALATNWRVQLAQAGVEDLLPDKLSLIERGRVYVRALDLLLGLVQGEIGAKLTSRALQRAFDALSWEEREVGSQYVFRDLAQAEVLSRDFHATGQDYRSLLRRMPLFVGMDEADLNLLCTRLKPAHYAAGQVIIRQGERGDTFFIIQHGHVAVSVRDPAGVSQVVNQLDRGDYFGELALLHDAPRNATCRATVPTDVLCLSRPDFEQLVRLRFDLREKLDRSIATAELLRRMPLFAELDARQVQLIASRMRHRDFQANEVLMQEGQTGRTFYVIESGQVQVSVRQEDGQEKAFAERGPGEYVGEIALLLKTRRTATVTAKTLVRTLTLGKDDFDKLVAAHLYVGRSLELETSRRMLNLRQAIRAKA